MKTLIVAIAAGFIAATAGAASAMPAAKAAQASESVRSGIAIEKADYRDRRRMLRKRDGHWGRGHRDWDNRRYYKYRSWNRYNSRPYGWRGRGCVSVGPIWFCP